MWTDNGLVIAASLGGGSHDSDENFLCNMNLYAAVLLTATPCWNISQLNSICLFKYVSLSCEETDHGDDVIHRQILELLHRR